MFLKPLQCYQLKETRQTMFLLPETRHVAAGPSVKYWLSLFTSADDAAAVWLLSPRSVSSLLLLCLFNGTVGAALEGFVRCSLLLTFLGPCVYCSLCLERLVKRYAPSLIFQQDSVDVTDSQGFVKDSNGEKVTDRDQVCSVYIQLHKETDIVYLNLYEPSVKPQDSMETYWSCLQT